MRKLLVFALAIVSLPAFSQKKDKYNLADRAADHLMVQFSSDHWSGTPDSINSHMGGFSRGANVYLMLDKPFKGNQHFSLAFGVGVGTSNIFFKKMEVDIASLNPVLPFRATDSSQNYKKYKLSTAFLEVPLEVRFSSNPANSNKAWKGALGVKGGVMLNAHTKGKTLRSKDGATINSAASKVLSKSYFNTSRLAATARVGYGIFSLFGAYNLTSLFKSGVAADMKLYQVGFTISGL